MWSHCQANKIICQWKYFMRGLTGGGTVSWFSSPSEAYQLMGFTLPPPPSTLVQYNRVKFNTLRVHLNWLSLHINFLFWNLQQHSLVYLYAWLHCHLCMFIKILIQTNVRNTDKKKYLVQKVSSLVLHLSVFNISCCRKIICQRLELPQIIMACSLQVLGVGSAFQWF